MLGHDDGSWWNDCKINLWNINQEHSGKFPWLCKIDFLCIHARISKEGMPREFRWLYPRLSTGWLCVCCGVMGTKVEFEWQLTPRLMPVFFLFFFVFFKCKYDIHYFLAFLGIRHRYHAVTHSICTVTSWQKVTRLQINSSPHRQIGQTVEQVFVPGRIHSSIWSHEQ